MTRLEEEWVMEAIRQENLRRARAVCLRDRLARDARAAAYWRQTAAALAGRVATRWL